MTGEDKELQAPACSAAWLLRRPAGRAARSRSGTRADHYWLTADWNAQQEEDGLSAENESFGLVPLTLADSKPLVCWAVGALRAN